MKQQQVTIILVTLALVWILQACQQNSNSTDTTTTNTVESTEQTITSEENLVGITPPLQNVDVPFKQYKINTDKAQTIQTETGTIIKIPKGAFTDLDGNPIEGKVDITYREFHDAAEIIASGIPMQNRDGGKYMETAGMFEINGTQAGNPIKIAEGKDVEVNMGSFVTGEKFDFFHFNKKTCNWETKGTAKPKPNQAKIAKLKALPKVPAKPVKPEKMDEASPDRIFDLEVDYALYPELKAYHGVVWQYSGNNPKKDPVQNPWVYKEDWQSIELKPVDPTTGKYSLELKNAQRTFKTDVVPALKGEDLKKALAKFKERNAEYVQIKKDREEEEERLQAEADLLRSFRVNQFGVFNWDVWKQPGRMLVNADFDFGIEKKKVENKITVFLVTGSRRSVIKYDERTKDRFSFDPSMENYLIAVLPGNQIATFDKEDFKKIDMNALRSQSGKPSYTFKMKVQNQAIASLNDLRTVIDKLI